MPAHDRPPSVQYYPRDWMSDPAVQSLSWDERGRYHWAWSCSLCTATPGLATEDQWRRWMGYSPEEWPLHRDAHVACFRVRSDGVWMQARTDADRRERHAYRMRARAGGDATRDRLSAETRTDNARRAAQVRWNKSDNADASMRTGCAPDARTASASASASASAVEPSALVSLLEDGDVCRAHPRAVLVFGQPLLAEMATKYQEIDLAEVCAKVLDLDPPPKNPKLTLRNWMQAARKNGMDLKPKRLTFGEDPNA